MTKDAKRQAAASQPFFVMMPERLADDDEISLVELCRILTHNKWLIFIVTLLFTLGAMVYAIRVTPIYRAEILLAPAKNDGHSGRIGELASRFGGLASLAGVSLPVGGDIETAIATLKSRRFISGFIDHHNLKPILFSDSWDPESKEWIITDPSIIARVKGIFLRDEKPEPSEPLAFGEPSMWRAHNYFIKEVLTVVSNKNSGLVTIQIDWKDPKLAADWGNALVGRLNIELRQQVIEESERGIMYLKTQVQETSLADLRMVLYRIIEEHTKNITLAKVNEQYALRVIDPAVPPQERIKPRRTGMVLLGFVIGVMIGVFIAFLREFIQRYRSSPEQASPEQGYFQFR